MSDSRLHWSPRRVGTHDAEEGCGCVSGIVGAVQAGEVPPPSAPLEVANPEQAIVCGVSFMEVVHESPSPRRPDPFPIVRLV